MKHMPYNKPAVTTSNGFPLLPCMFSDMLSVCECVSLSVCLCVCVCGVGEMSRVSEF